ncbi:MAG: 50S ribosomal protein L23 [Bacteroidia bacterium]|jgi:large subunit ribosomal protein L23
MEGIILKPIVTEKYTKLATTLNQYGFIVTKNANKVEIKKTIEKMYGVTVDSVNTQNYRGKFKSRYTRSGIASGFAKKNRKAIVTLKKGETIDFYSNI